MPLFFGSDEERLWINAQLSSGKIDVKTAIRYLSQWCSKKIDRLCSGIPDPVLREKQRKKLASIRAHM